MPRRNHLIIGGLAFASLAGVILVWPDASRPIPARHFHTDRISTHSVERIPTPAHRRIIHRRDAKQSGKNSPTWPLPTIPASEVETKRAEMLAAFGDASKIENPDEQNNAFARICYRWAGFDPRGAIESAIAWELEEIPGLFENLALQWASTDLPSAREWAGMQPPGEFRSELVMRIGYAMAHDDPAAAADYVIRETQPGPVQAEAAIAVLHQWALNDLAAAHAWAGSTLSGDLQRRAFQEIKGIESYR